MTKTFGAQFASLVGCAVLAVGCTGDLPPNPAPDMVAVDEIRAGFESSDDSSGVQEEVAGPTGLATLSGKFTITGDLPKPTQLTISKDANVCAPGGKAVYEQDLVVGDGGALANVIVFADKVPDSWVHESAKTPAEEEVIFDQKECVFLTRVVAMTTSQRLKVLNSDKVGHNLMVKSFNEIIPSGGSTFFSTKKQDAVPAKMSCSIHPWMSAWFMGRNNGYFAVTKPDGSFEIPNLPAGVEVKFKVWQERLGFVKGAIKVNGQDAKWKKGRFALTLAPDAVQEMNVVLSAADL